MAMVGSLARFWQMPVDEELPQRKANLSHTFMSGVQLRSMLYSVGRVWRRHWISRGETQKSCVLSSDTSSLHGLCCST